MSLHLLKRILELGDTQLKTKVSLLLKWINIKNKYKKQFFFLMRISVPGLFIFGNTNNYRETNCIFMQWTFLFISLIKCCVKILLKQTICISNAFCWKKKDYEVCKFPLTLETSVPSLLIISHKQKNNVFGKQWNSLLHFCYEYIQHTIKYIFYFISFSAPGLGCTQNIIAIWFISVIIYEMLRDGNN